MWFRSCRRVRRIPAHAVYDRCDVFGYKWYHTKSRYYCIYTRYKFGKKVTVIKSYVRRKNLTPYD